MRPGFHHYFFDRFLVETEPHEYATWLRKYGPAPRYQSRSGLSDLIGVSAATIRRYESEWGSRPPKWYFLLLRFLAGDLSFYGHHWTDCRIRPDTGKLRTPVTREEMTPMDLNSRYSMIVRSAQSEAADARRRLADMENEVQALRSERELLLLKIDTLTGELEAARNHTAQITAGKVVPLFGHKKAR
ncbi:MAG: hypothetical protein LC637_05025 [Xanthomonadaceae bacterium]|nr:hypothetical protein [Xanthomonadaceae bacterium]